jgi:oligopeptide/dipeptide ABC transporter ATP-binding protein
LPLRAVDSVGFAIGTGETVGLVGESGSGKSTIGRAVLGLTSATSGTIRLDGHDITDASREERRLLSSTIQTVFQDPFGSLNPARTVGQTLAETLRPHGITGRSQVAERVATMLERVGLPVDAAGGYPARFSGGQRQRIAIARSLMAHPRLVICDEPVSALDLSVQAQVLNLLASLQEEFGVGYLFISHDLTVVRHISHRIMVLYRGRIMESGDATAVYDRPAHPYTAALLASVPIPDPERQRERRALRRATLSTSDLSAPTPADGCPFAPRCPHAGPVCWSQRPVPERTPDGVLVACHRWQELQNPLFIQKEERI